MNKRVLVGMSGGVDSSATCLLLKEQGYEPVGMTMRVWDLERQFTDGENEPNFVLAAKRLANRLNMEHVTIDVRKEFKNVVVKYFTDEYMAGRTPNPCVLCNKKFKFRLLQEWADKLNCSYVSTGHYVKTEQHNNKTYLLMGDDVKKDQSYFLWRVPQEILTRCIFPLGGMEKPNVRAYLAKCGFTPEAKQSESMEVCFVEGDYRNFLRQQIPNLNEQVAGGIYVDNSGHTLGSHLGYPFYTVGQRKGLGIAMGWPAFVLRINAQKNTIVLGNEEDTATQALFIEDWNVVDENEFFTSTELSVRIRYHSLPVGCSVEKIDDGRLLLRTNEVVNSVTPGQSAVFYIGKRLVAGGVIASQRGIGAYK